MPKALMTVAMPTSHGLNTLSILLCAIFDGKYKTEPKFRENVWTKKKCSLAKRNAERNKAIRFTVSGKILIEFPVKNQHSNYAGGPFKFETNIFDGEMK